MFQFFPDPNIARSAQIFEVWIRPVVPVNAHMALRIAVHELDKLIREGMTKEAFESTRDYLMKNVFVMTATQNQQIGYALDSKWYGIGDFASRGYGAEPAKCAQLQRCNPGYSTRIDAAGCGCAGRREQRRPQPAAGSRAGQSADGRKCIEACVRRWPDALAAAGGRRGAAIEGR